MKAVKGEIVMFNPSPMKGENFNPAPMTGIVTEVKMEKRKWDKEKYEWCLIEVAGYDKPFWKRQGHFAVLNAY